MDLRSRQEDGVITLEDAIEEQSKEFGQLFEDVKHIKLCPEVHKSYYRFVKSKELALDLRKEKFSTFAEEVARIFPEESERKDYYINEIYEILNPFGWTKEKLSEKHHTSKDAENYLWGEWEYDPKFSLMGELLPCQEVLNTFKGQAISKFEGVLPEEMLQAVQLPTKEVFDKMSFYEREEALDRLNLHLIDCSIEYSRIEFELKTVSLCFVTRIPEGSGFGSIRGEIERVSIYSGDYSNIPLYLPDDFLGNCKVAKLELSENVKHIPCSIVARVTDRVNFDGKEIFREHIDRLLEMDKLSESGDLSKSSVEDTFDRFPSKKFLEVFAGAGMECKKYLAQQPAQRRSAPRP